MNASEIHAKVASLPALPVVIARSMLVAQSFKLTGSERAAVQARCDFQREIGIPVGVQLTVKSPRGEVLGSLHYSI